MTESEIKDCGKSPEVFLDAIYKKLSQ
jgi:hypothetical protein